MSSASGTLWTRKRSCLKTRWAKEILVLLIFVAIICLALPCEALKAIIESGRASNISEAIEVYRNKN